MTHTISATTAPLQLEEVLTRELPATVGTPSAPDHYTVAVVFSRRVTTEEKTLIESASGVAKLAEAGYPRVALGVSDRRLLINNTTLEELVDGLAERVGQVVDEAVRTVAQRRADQLQAAEDTRDIEEQRVAKLTALIGQIRFDAVAQAH